MNQFRELCITDTRSHGHTHGRTDGRTWIHRTHPVKNRGSNKGFRSFITVHHSTYSIQSYKQTTNGFQIYAFLFISHKTNIIQPSYNVNKSFRSFITVHHSTYSIQSYKQPTNGFQIYAFLFIYHKTNINQPS